MDAARIRNRGAICGEFEIKVHVVAAQRRAAVARDIGIGQRPVTAWVLIVIEQERTRIVLLHASSPPGS
jgi:hypothetical protein